MRGKIHLWWHFDEITLKTGLYLMDFMANAVKAERNKREKIFLKLANNKEQSMAALYCFDNLQYDESIKYNVQCHLCVINEVFMSLYMTCRTS